LVERQFCKLDVAGSIPAAGTNKIKALCFARFCIAESWVTPGSQNDELSAPFQFFPLRFELALCVAE
jgi:hypothetical protein